VGTAVRRWITRPKNSEVRIQNVKLARLARGGLFV
jgi:hypothetical protein